ncbi:MAG: DNRLRE domain-containing protein, partial [Candidatus Heimdallarchaeaceae archaeon]
MSIEIQPEENKEEVVDLHPDPIEVKSFDDIVKQENPVMLSNITRNLGNITAGSIKLSNAWHIDKNGNMWWGDYDTYDDAIIKISAAGVVNLTSGVFSGDISAATGKYLETFTAGENITQGDAVSTAGLFSQTSEADMLTDANVRENTPGGTFGGTASYVEFYAGQRKYALYKFFLTNLITKNDEPQYEIISVILHIKAVTADIPIALHKITEDWSDSTVTWNNKPSFSSTVFWSGTPDVGDNEIDITTLYKEDINGPIYGFAFLPVSGGDTVQTILRTSEATAEPPYLVIYYRKRVVGEIYKAIASDMGCAYGFMGFADETKSATESIKIAISGIETHQSSLERGQKYYLSDTAGGISTSPGALYSDSIGIVVGKAISETKLL